MPDTCTQNTPVYKGSAQKPTTVIMCGSIPANSQGVGRDLLIDAYIKGLLKAIRNPKSRGVN